ncbi:hypothetical protein CJ030_MR2G027134 [Morella rubra]|uniref:RNase H type-1 domain-containing protein n=1 Tax=Morella rubra TaxID=262757 RepID=A0A6A1W8H6_9ROSI|nr:hypothetical protein CJ030_MR2G027134 [Morella rubra]
MRDHKGKVVEAQIFKEIVDSPLEGEAVAAQLGIQEAIRRDLKSVQLEGDALLAIKALQNFLKLEAIHRSLNHFDFVEFKFVKRDTNCVTTSFSLLAASQ